MRFFRPHITYNHYNDIDIKLLNRLNIITIIVDIDNTLAVHYDTKPDKSAIEFINKLKNNGFNIFAMSNNTKERVSTFCKDLDIKGYHFSLKPLKRNYKKLIRENNIDNKVAIIGDQLLTDILGGNRMKFTTIYTKPLVDKDIKWTKLNRIIEKVIIKRLNKNNLLEVGKYYE